MVWVRSCCCSLGGVAHDSPDEHYKPLGEAPKDFSKRVVFSALFLVVFPARTVTGAYLEGGQLVIPCGRGITVTLPAMSGVG